MITYIQVLILLLILMTIFVVLLIFQYRHKVHEMKRMYTMIDNLSSYAFLIDKDFTVKETNYYALNPSKEKKEPQILGNVLHCSTACESGTCGHGLTCKNCPVRFVIAKSFERKSDFHDLEVGMELQIDGNNVTDVDVNVGGRYVSVEGEPYMVLNIKDVSESKRLLRRYIDQHLSEETGPGITKVLFATQDVALYNRLRDLLKDKCRLVYVETAQQVLNRVGKGKDYGYAAVVLDETFLHENNILEQLNEHIVVIKLTEDGMSGVTGHMLSVPLTISGEELKGIIVRQFK